MKGESQVHEEVNGLTSENSKDFWQRTNTEKIMTVSAFEDWLIQVQE